MGRCSSCGGTPANAREMRAASMLPDGPDGFFIAEAYPDCDPSDRYEQPPEETPLRLILVGRATDLEQWFLPSQFEAASAHAKANRLRAMTVPAQAVCRQLVEDLLAAAATPAP